MEKQLIKKYGNRKLIQILKELQPHLNRKQQELNRGYLRKMRFGSSPARTKARLGPGPTSPTRSSDPEPEPPSPPRPLESFVGLIIAEFVETDVFKQLMPGRTFFYGGKGNEIKIRKAGGISWWVDAKHDTAGKWPPGSHSAGERDLFIDLLNHETIKQRIIGVAEPYEGGPGKRGEIERVSANQVFSTFYPEKQIQIVPDAASLTWLNNAQARELFQRLGTRTVYTPGNYYDKKILAGYDADKYVAGEHIGFSNEAFVGMFFKSYTTDDFYLLVQEGVVENNIANVNVHLYKLSPDREITAVGKLESQINNTVIKKFIVDHKEDDPIPYFTERLTIQENRDEIICLLYAFKHIGDQAQPVWIELLHQEDPNVIRFLTSGDFNLLTSTLNMEFQNVGLILTTAPDGTRLIAFTPSDMDGSDVSDPKAILRLKISQLESDILKITISHDKIKELGNELKPEIVEWLKNVPSRVPLRDPPIDFNFPDPEAAPGTRKNYSIPVPSIKHLIQNILDTRRNKVIYQEVFGGKTLTTDTFGERLNNFFAILDQDIDQRADFRQKRRELEILLEHKASLNVVFSEEDADDTTITAFSEDTTESEKQERFIFLNKGAKAAYENITKEWQTAYDPDKKEEKLQLPEWGKGGEIKMSESINRLYPEAARSPDRKEGQPVDPDSLLTPYSLGSFGKKQKRWVADLKGKKKIVRRQVYSMRKDLVTPSYFEKMTGADFWKLPVVK